MVTGLAERQFSNTKPQSIYFKVDPRHVTARFRSTQSAKHVEYGTPSQTTVYAKSLWAFWRGGIQARRRVVNLACSCSGEARLHRIDLIREDASDPVATRSRNDDNRDCIIQRARS